MALHCLQMACEKLAKAHMVASCVRGPGEVTDSHAYAGKVLHIVFREMIRCDEGVLPHARDWRVLALRALAREIDLLHPQVDAGGSRPDNCEYPWADALGDPQVPSRWAFAQYSQACHETTLGILLRTLRSAIADIVAAAPELHQ
jgi:hypothetical protein